ncbi:hypothetical protein OH492_19580 [Vibrio chagasii]|nr:hypothetical protein [Vibrio chagasii]
MVEGTNTQMAIDLLCCHRFTGRRSEKTDRYLTPEAAQTNITETINKH